MNTTLKDWLALAIVAYLMITPLYVAVAVVWKWSGPLLEYYEGMRPTSPPPAPEIISTELIIIMVWFVSLIAVGVFDRHKRRRVK